MNFLRKKWSFWVNALLLIILIMLGLYLFNDKLGLTEVFAGMPDYANDAAQQKDIPDINWSWQAGLLAGVLVGGLCGSLIHGSWKIVLAWEECSSFASKVFKTVFGGFFAGFLVMFGAILSGEIFCGQFASAMQLSAGSWFFLITALAVGGITALFIERSRAAGSPKSSKGKEGE